MKVDALTIKTELTSGTRTCTPGRLCLNRPATQSLAGQRVREIHGGTVHIVRIA